MHNSIDLENINTLQWTQFAATNGFHYENVWNPIDSGDKSNPSCLDDTCRGIEWHWGSRRWSCRRREYTTQSPTIPCCCTNRSNVSESIPLPQLIQGFKFKSPITNTLFLSLNPTLIRGSNSRPHCFLSTNYCLWDCVCVQCRNRSNANCMERG